MSELIVVGARDGERGRAYRASLAAAGLAPINVVDYREFLGARPPAPARFAPGTIIRLESPSDDPSIDDELLRLGGYAGSRAPTELLPGAAWFAGFSELARRVEAWLAAAPPHRRMQHLPSVLAMTDKTGTLQRLALAGAPVPEFLAEPPSEWAGMRTAADDLGWQQVFVKARYGSSAAGQVAVRWHGERVAGWTTVELRDGIAHNTRRPVRLSSHDEVARIVRMIDSFHVERWLPKVSFAGGIADFRIVVIAGQARHVLVRIGSAPFTNLHLGAQRGDVAAARTHFGPAWDALAVTAERAAACFPESLYAGVDLGLVERRPTPVVWELNAFGDFHEGIEVNGMDTYQTQLAALGVHPAA